MNKEGQSSIIDIRKEDPRKIREEGDKFQPQENQKARWGGKGGHDHKSL